MKLGIIMPPKPESFQQAKSLGLDFVEFDCNPTSFFGVPVSELEAGKEELKAASGPTATSGPRSRPLSTLARTWGPSTICAA